MPEEKLSYTRGVLDKVRASYEKLSREELLDLICYITKTYITEQTIPFDVPIPERSEPSAEESPPDAEVIDRDSAPRGSGPPVQSAAQRFATLVEGLKKRTQLPQLEHFTVEDGRAVLVVDNQKVTFGERVTVEFVPRGRASPSSTPGPAPAPAAPAAAPAPPAPRSAPFEAPAPPPPPSARKDLPGGDGRMHQQGARPRPEPAPAPPPPAKKAPEKPSGDLADVDHIVERFKRLDLD